MSRPVKIQVGVYRMTAYGTKKSDYLITNSKRSGWHIYSRGSLVGTCATLRGAEEMVDAMNRRDRKVHEEGG